MFSPSRVRMAWARVILKLGRNRSSATAVPDGLHGAARTLATVLLVALAAAGPRWGGLGAVGGTRSILLLVDTSASMQRRGIWPQAVEKIHTLCLVHICSALEEIEADPSRHGRAARAIAEEYFAAERVRYSNDALGVEQVKDPQRIAEEINAHGTAVGSPYCHQSSPADSNPGWRSLR